MLAAADEIENVPETAAARPWRAVGRGGRLSHRRVSGSKASTSAWVAAGRSPPATTKSPSNAAPATPPRAVGISGPALRGVGRRIVDLERGQVLRQGLLPPRPRTAGRAVRRRPGGRGASAPAAGLPSGRPRRRTRKARSPTPRSPRHQRRRPCRPARPRPWPPAPTCRRAAPNP